MQEIEIPGVGILEFPDGMTDEQMRDAIYRNFPDVEPKGFLEGLYDGAKEAITGESRRTETTESLPDWVGLPEFNGMSLSALKASLGTMTAGPDEIAQILQANFPDVQTRQDEKGNYIFKSAEDGNEYALKPGFRPSDIPRAIFGGLAFTPAGRATNITGAGLAAGATEAGIQATQAGTGGSFDPGQIAASSVGGAAVPAIGKGLSAARETFKGALANQAAQSLDNAAPPVPAQASEGLDSGINTVCLLYTSPSPRD